MTLKNSLRYGRRSFILEDLPVIAEAGQSQTTANPDIHDPQQRFWDGGIIPQCDPQPDHNCYQWIAMPFLKGKQARFFYVQVIDSEAVLAGQS